MRFKDTDACKCLEGAWPSQMLSNGNFLFFSPFPLHPSWVHSGHSEKTRGMESGQAEDELG